MSSTGLIPLDLSRKRKLSYSNKSPNSFLDDEGWSPSPEPSSDRDKTEESPEDSAFNLSGQIATNKDQSEFVQEELPLGGWDEVVDLSLKSSVDMNVFNSRYRNGGKDSRSGRRLKRTYEPFLPCGLEPALNDRGQFVCMFCPKTFVHKYPYRDHIKTHTGDSPRCQLCWKPFPKNHNLLLHMRTHTGEKPYECPICTRGFADRSNLKVHLRGHTGERPYNCDFCNRTFVNSSRLVVHRRLHTGEKPFYCEVCSLSFVTSHQRSTHMKSHSSEPAESQLALATNTLNETFRDPPSLVVTNQHNDSVAGKPFRCLHCGIGYSQAASLQLHIPICRDVGY